MSVDEAFSLPALAFACADNGWGLSSAGGGDDEGLVVG